jgi:hypothetical protein
MLIVTFSGLQFGSRFRLSQASETMANTRADHYGKQADDFTAPV